MTAPRSGTPPRVIVVGAGEVAESYWLPGAALLGSRVDVIDVDRERARALAGRSGASVGSAASLAEASPTEDDIVVVATPPTAHGAVVREAVGVGARRVMVEKPPFASSADLEQTARVVADHRTAIGVAFIRRLWRPVITARRLYPLWHERLGALVRVRITEGAPYGWQSRAADERGIAGLSGMFLDELPHPLDALFGIAGWTGVTTGEVRRARVEPLDVDVELDLEVDSRRVGLHVLGSRVAQLPTALDLGFEQGSVTVEMRPNGGIVVRPRGGERTLISCDGMSTGVETMFAELLRSLAARPLTASADGLDTWRGPLAVIELVQAAA